MLLINHFLVLFTVTIFSSTGAMQDFNDRPEISQIVQVEDVKVKISEYCKDNERAVAAYEHFETALLESDLSDEDVDRVLSAAIFAAQKHKDQVRKDAARTPYIVHPIGVAHSILQVAEVSTPEILMAALLHDTVEDTDTSFAELIETFGPEVEGYVREVTDDKTLTREEIKQLQIDHASEKSEGAAVIKMADKLYNLTDIHLNPPPSWSQKRCDDYFRWAENVTGNLPEASPELKASLEKLIQAYWAKRGVSSLDDQSGLQSGDLTS